MNNSAKQNNKNDCKPELRNQGVQTPGPPAFPKINKFTPKQRSEASEAQSRAAKEANRSKAWMKSRFSSARVEFDTERERKLGMIPGPNKRLVNNSKVHVALSSCLNGESVRHNAGHCFAPFIVDDMGEFLSFESVCPEVEGLGLGTPRETIRLVNTSGDLEDWGLTTLMGTKSGNNYTSMMASYTASKLKNLDIAGINGYILKALSPSCGLRGIPVYPTLDTKGRGNGKAQSGMFAKALMELWPELPIEDEGRLADVSLRHSFYTRVEAHRRWRCTLQQRASAREQGNPYRPLITFHNNHLLLADSHDSSSVVYLEAIIEEISTQKDKVLEDNLYHRYYNTFFMALKRTCGRASTARCLRHCLAILEGNDDKKEIVPENESETAAEGEIRREKDLDNDLMLGMLTDYGDESKIIKYQEVNSDKEVGQAQFTVNSSAPHFIKRINLIDKQDSMEIAEAIKDYYNAEVPLSMPLACIKRQLDRLSRERKKHEDTAKKLDCDMGEFKGTRALNLLENQAFLQPHKCKRVLSTIRQNKFGQTFEPSHVFTCL